MAVEEWDKLLEIKMKQELAKNEKAGNENICKASIEPALGMTFRIAYSKKAEQKTGREPHPLMSEFLESTAELESGPVEDMAAYDRRVLKLTKI